MSIVIGKRVQSGKCGNCFLLFIFQDITDNQAVSDPAFYSLIILYALVIIGSVVGNVLVITAVLKSEKMRKVSESNVTTALHAISFYLAFVLNLESVLLSTLLVNFQSLIQN